MLKNRNLKIFVSIILGIILFYFWFKMIDRNALIGYLKQVNFGLACLAFFVYIFSYYIRAYRWKIILSPNCKIKQKDSFAYLMAGNFINYIIPIRAGELAKCYLLNRNHKLEVSKAFSSVFVDKLFDTLGIFIILLLIPFIPLQLNKYLFSLIFLLLLIFLLGVFIILFASLKKEKAISFLNISFFFLPNKYKKKVEQLINQFVDGVALFKGRTNLLNISILLTVFSVVCDSLFFWLLFRSFEQNIEFFYVLFGYTLIYLSYILPHPPAQIGSNELIAVLIFTWGFGLSKNMVSAVMAFSHLITGIIVILVGLISLSYAGMKVIDFMKYEGKNETIRK
ncbi:MAG: lysylphosphatidylglycerol synthase transmembrane domain-containing protein [Candidatus Cloacimonadales bacterium]|nr:flippase-like domain-containing protein [Candidatus Cloacimonadota bacterium]MDD2650276.1 lysylphosphatidylglycerol synthase transmembrane domain-containing protein [Candidatus Cloacimonadota bacterium]MDD3501245.1 lysylphosphatidylglycerol synthase transmembrane domain-containing protein [Candidatus Cloacimonadota bacterium]MDX9977539.1 lysylphosphatidylglycerol synthase transmembrane domain-containing protein [Candidatus Cloacimonadales bacterium]